MKNIKFIMICIITVIGLSACTTRITNVTDIITLYPDNKPAEKWGVIEHIEQYVGYKNQRRMSIELPNKETVSGQITFIDQSSTTTSYNTWDNAYFGFDYGRGGNYGLGYGIGFSPIPSVSTIRTDVMPFTFNSFGEKTRMNCTGLYNRRQKLGTIDCELSNNMKYKGHFRRIETYQTVQR